MVQEAPLSSQVALFKLFPFTSTLNIRVWDSQVSTLGMHLFGLDFVDMDGKPQHVGDAVKVVVGKRGTPGGFEVEGNPVLPIEAAVGEDDEEYFEVFGVYGDLRYEFYYEGCRLQTYLFPYDLLH